MDSEQPDHLSLLVQLHDQLEKIQANKKGLKRLREKVKKQRQKLEAAEALIESQNTLITLLSNKH